MNVNCVVYHSLYLLSILLKIRSEAVWVTSAEWGWLKYRCHISCVWMCMRKYTLDRGTQCGFLCSEWGALGEAVNKRFSVSPESEVPLLIRKAREMMKRAGERDRECGFLPRWQLSNTKVVITRANTTNIQNQVGKVSRDAADYGKLDHFCLLFFTVHHKLAFFHKWNKYMGINNRKIEHDRSAIKYRYIFLKEKKARKNQLLKEIEKCTAIFHLLVDNPLLHENQCSNYQIASYKAP